MIEVYYEISLLQVVFWFSDYFYVETSFTLSKKHEVSTWKSDIWALTFSQNWILWKVAAFLLFHQLLKKKIIFVWKKSRFQTIIFHTSPEFLSALLSISEAKKNRTGTWWMDGFSTKCTWNVKKTAIWVRIFILVCIYVEQLKQCELYAEI